jgi:hypothetical protein
MFAWLRRLGGHVHFETPRAEPHRDDLRLAELFPPAPDLVEAIKQEQRINALDQAAYRAWKRRDLMSMNNWLDDRNDIRPARPAPVPVIPGRSS